MEKLEIAFGRAPRLTVAAIQLKGSYSKIGEGMVELAGIMAAMGLAPTGKPFALLYDNPLETREEALISEVCIPTAEFESTGGLMFKVFEPVEVAETRHAGPPEKYTETYGRFLELLVRHGYRLVGPAREYFERPAKDNTPGRGFLIQQPIAKKNP